MERLRHDKRFNADTMQLVMKKLKHDNLSEEEITRFVVACNGDDIEACCRLESTIKWRQSIFPLQTCEKCILNPLSHSHIPIGIELLELSTIFYGCPARGVDFDVDDIEKHVARALEFAFASKRTGSR